MKLILIGVVAVISFFLLKDMIDKKQSTPVQPGDVHYVDTATPTLDTPQQSTMDGEVVCLPHRNTEGSHTMECAFGIKTDDGNYYAFDTVRMANNQPNFTTGERIRANGVLTPIEYLSTNHWQKYDIKGIFSITDSPQKL